MDLWFWEGVAVPEPNALALLGSSSLLVFSIKRRSKPFAVFLAVLLFAFLILPVHGANDSVIQATAEEAGLAPATTLPRTGTFWVITSAPNGQLITLPYPALPANLSALPIYSVAGNTFLVDDTGGQISSASTAQTSRIQTAAIALAQSEDVSNLI